MYQSGKLRSQSPDPTEDTELSVVPSAEISDPSLESLLGELLQEYQDAFGTEESASTRPSKEHRFPLPIPQSLCQYAAPESLSAESEPSSATAEARLSQEIRDLAFELLLQRLTKSQNAIRTERSTRSSPSENPQAPLPIPSSLMPATKPKSPGEAISEGRDFVSPLLPFLVATFAMMLGVLLGMHTARNRGETRALKQSESAASLPRFSASPSSESAPDVVARGNPLVQQSGSSHQTGSRHPHLTAPAQPHTLGELTVYQNDEVILRLPPGQGGMLPLVPKRPD
jgi:hypothetical protein